MQNDKHSERIIERTIDLPCHSESDRQHALAPEGGRLGYVMLIPTKPVSCSRSSADTHTTERVFNPNYEQKLEATNGHCL